MTSPVLDVRFLVEGRPVPKGSMSGFPITRGPCQECKPGAPCRRRNCVRGMLVGVSITDQGGTELKAWGELVHVRALSARNAAGQRMVTRPNALEVMLIFVMARPAGHWTKAGALTAAGRDQFLPTVKPDADKLSRGVLDGLTRALAEDDAQVIVAPTAIVYADHKGWTGVTVRARQISSYPAWVTDELAHHGVWTAPMQETLL